MANYATLKAALDAVIKTNTNRDITGDVLNTQLDGMIDALGAGYQFVGEATPSGTPGTPDYNAAYIARTSGTYTNYGGLTLAAGEIALLKYNGTWTKTTIFTGLLIVSITSAQDGSLVFTMANGDTVTIDFNHVHPQYFSKAAETTQPSGGFAPDVVYKLGTITGTVTFALANPVVGNTNHYFWTFDTGSTAPTVTWPSGITWADGTGPTVAASKHYEISILDGIATFAEVEP